MAGIYDERILGAKQQAETARKLREGISAPQGQMVSGWYVPPSITQYMANALKSYGAGKEERTAQSEYERMQKQKETETAAILRQLEPQASVQVSPEMANAAYGQGDINSVMANPMPQTQTTYQPVDERTRMAALLRGAAVNPEAFQPQMQMAQWDIGRQDKQEAMQQAEALRREQMQQQLNMQQERMQSQQEMSRQAAADRMALARMTMANRPEKLLTAMDESGVPFTVPQSQFQSGMQLYNPQTAKTMAAEKQKTAARQQMTDLVSQLGSYYDTLEKGGGIQSTENSSLSNVLSRVQSSGLGQMVGGALGTENQSARESISMTRPLLLNAIKNATGMSAQQMNSNAEMQLYLNAATNPQLGVEANRRALENLDKLYGLGVFKSNAMNQQPAGGMQPQGGAQFLGFE